MKPAIKLAVFAAFMFLLCAFANAQSNVVFFRFTDSQSNPQTNRYATLTGLCALPGYNGNYVAPFPMVQLTDTNGTAYFTNVIPGYEYVLEFDLPYKPFFWTNGFPTNLTGTNNGWQYNGIQAGNFFAYFNSINTNLFVNTVDDRGFTNTGSIKLTGAITNGTSFGVDIAGVVTMNTLISDGNNLFSDGSGDLTAASFTGIGSPLTGIYLGNILTNGLASGISGQALTLTSGGLLAWSNAGTTINTNIFVGTNGTAGFTNSGKVLLTGGIYDSTGQYPIASNEATVVALLGLSNAIPAANLVGIVPIANGGTGYTSGMAQGMTNSSLAGIGSGPIYPTNINSISYLVFGDSFNGETNISANPGWVFMFPGADNSPGIYLPLQGTNYKNGAYPFNVLPNGQTNYIIDPYALNIMVGPQNGVNINNGAVGLLANGEPMAFGGFFGGVQMDFIYWSNAVIHVGYTTNVIYDPQSNSFANDIFEIDQQHRNIALTNLGLFLLSSAQLVVNGNGGISSTNVNAGVSMANGAGTFSNLTVGNIVNINSGSGNVAIQFDNSLEIGPAHGGNDVSIYGNGTEIISFSTSDQVTMRGNYNFNWANDGGGYIGGPSGNRPGAVYAKTNITAPELIVATNNSFVAMASAITNGQSGIVISNTTGTAYTYLITSRPGATNWAATLLGTSP